MTSARLLLAFLLNRGAVRAHMPWMRLSEQGTAVDLFFGEGVVPDPDLITTLEDIHDLDFVNAEFGTRVKVGVHLVDAGYMHGHLPRDYERPATVAGFLNYGDFGPSTQLHYSFTTQAHSEDPAADWDNTFQDFAWVDELYETRELFAALKNFGGPPYELATNGIPGMTSVQGCLYRMEALTGSEVELGCTEQEIVGEYDGDSIIVNINVPEEEAPCAGQTYYFRARTRDNFNPAINMNVSSYATGSVVWDVSGRKCPKGPVSASE